MPGREPVDAGVFERDPAATEPVVSVVIPTYNRRERLERVLVRLADQEVAVPFEVIVVSDGSTDDTEEYLAGVDLPLDLRWATQPNAGPAAARNRGVDMARTDLIVFVDDDVLPDAGLLTAHLAAQDRHGPSAVVIGPMLDPDDHEMSPWVAWEQRMLYKQYRALVDREYEPTFRQFYTGNVSIPRAELLAAGGFDPQYRRAEDIELGIRLYDRGARFAYEPDAQGFHYAIRSFDAWRAIAGAYGRMEVEFGNDPARQWQWEFISHSFRARHPALRLLVRLTLRWPGATDSIVDRAPGLIERLHRSRLARPGQWLLSAIYATDYWRAVAEAVGGRSALFEVVRAHRPPRFRRNTSATPQWDAANAPQNEPTKGSA